MAEARGQCPLLTCGDRFIGHPGSGRSGGAPINLSNPSPLDTNGSSAPSLCGGLAHPGSPSTRGQ